MKYAVIKTGGKQYKIQESDTLKVEKLMGESGKNVDFGQVLLFVDEANVLIGQPLVEGVKVEAKILEHCKGPKIRIAKFKAKSGYRKVKGHRQELSKIRIEKIKLAKPTKKVNEGTKDKKRKPKAAN